MPTSRLLSAMERVEKMQEKSLRQLGSLEVTVKTNTDTLKSITDSLELLEKQVEELTKKGDNLQTRAETLEKKNTVLHKKNVTTWKFTREDGISGSQGIASGLEKTSRGLSLTCSARSPLTSVTSCPLLWTLHTAWVPAPGRIASARLSSSSCQDPTEARSGGMPESQHYSKRERLKYWRT